MNCDDEWHWLIIPSRPETCPTCGAGSKMSIENPIARELTHWLMKTYECINVPMGAVPPPPSQYDVPEGKCVFLARNQIAFESDPIDFKDRKNYDLISEKMDKFFKDFKTKIIEELEKDGIHVGDELYVGEYPIILEDELLWKQRKIGFYGWLEVFSKATVATP